MGSIVLSFDVGIKNLAYCMYNTSQDAIMAWDIIDLSNNTSARDLDSLSKALVDALDDLVSSRDVESWHVLIENQPVMKNPTMKSIQMMIYTYFRILHIHGHCVATVQFVSAMKKNSYMKSKGYMLKPKDYQSNKASSIECVKKCLEAKDQHTQWLAVLDAHKKKDDLCDAFLQIMSCLPGTH